MRPARRSALLRVPLDAWDGTMFSCLAKHNRRDEQKQNLIVEMSVSVLRILLQRLIGGTMLVERTKPEMTWLPVDALVLRY